MKYTLIFSEMAAKDCGSLSIRIEGKEFDVEYTAVHSAGGDWRDYYKWPDAHEVGQCDSLENVKRCRRGPTIFGVPYNNRWSEA